MDTADDLDIGEVSRRTGIRPSALRYYEKRGLIASNGRAGLRRQYAPDVLERLALLSAAQSSGFSLGEIADLLAASSSDSTLRRRLSDKADELDRRIDDLVRMREGLRHAAGCPHPRLAECPDFRRALQAFAPVTRQ